MTFSDPQKFVAYTADRYIRLISFIRCHVSQWFRQTCYWNSNVCSFQCEWPSTKHMYTRYKCVDYKCVKSVFLTYAAACGLLMRRKTWFICVRTGRKYKNILWIQKLSINRIKTLTLFFFERYYDAYTGLS